MLERNKRIKPGLDDKQLLSTNAQTISALATAYIVTGNQAYLDSALKCMAFIEDNFSQHGSEHLFHTFTKGKADIDAFADDYASLIEAYIYLYHATFTKTFMGKAKELMDYSMQHFFDAEQGLFYFTHHQSEKLFARKFETQDNVTPASNSVFAKCLFVLGRYFSNNVYVALSKEMLAKVQSELEHYAPAFSNWSILQLWITNGYYDVVVYGRNAQEKSSPLKNFL
ncbi:MAG: thioredoxin domain-containing protein [Bacteroidetes bacterium]|nr:thioredoxin domain-containing protein [Bacteroidota bacterium]